MALAGSTLLVAHGGGWFGQGRGKTVSLFWPVAAHGGWRDQEGRREKNSVLYSPYLLYPPEKKRSTSTRPCANGRKSPVDLAAVTDSRDRDLLLAIIDCVENSVFTHSKSATFPACELLRPIRPWILIKGQETFRDSLTNFFRKCVELLLSRPLDDNSVGHKLKSSSFGVEQRLPKVSA